jgi:ATP-dependent protease ClpP protease subunit
MNRPNPTEVRAFLNRRADTRPRNEAPTVRLDGATAQIRLFDPIDSWGEWWGMSAKELADALDDLPSNITTIELLINSPGGDAFDGLAMVNVLRAHAARIVAVVQGLAASAASFIACSADELVMAPNSTLMIHDAWGICVGNADDMLSMGATLDQLSDNIADIYAAKAGNDVATWRDAMRDETWYTAEEALAAGLADRVDSTGTTEDEPASNLAPAQPSAELADTDADPVRVVVASHDSDALELLNL